jgi:hypothetical protein
MVVSVLVSFAATAAVVLVPTLRFAYRLPEVHVGLETAAALVGLLAAFLVFGRFRRSGQLGDFFLCYSLTVLALSNLFFAALPAVLGGTDTLGTWARLFAQLLGSALFAAAAFAPMRRIRLSGIQTIVAMVSLPAIMVCIAVGVS